MILQDKASQLKDVADFAEPDDTSSRKAVGNHILTDSSYACSLGLEEVDIGSLIFEALVLEHIQAELVEYLIRQPVILVH